MILEQMKEQKNFTDTDRAIAEYLLHEGNADYTMTSTELAKACAVSQSAVIRFCNKLNGTGYRQFMMDLYREKAEEERNTVMNLEAPFDRVLRIPDAQKAVSEIYSNVITRTNQVLDTACLQRLIQRLIHAKMIDIYGYGISGLYARQLAFDLQTLGLPVRFNEGENTKYIEEKNYSGTVSVFIAFTGTNASLIHTAETIRRKGGYCFAAAGRKNTPLSEVCTESITFAPEYYDALDNLSFEIAISYVNHLICSVLMSFRNE